MTTNFDDLTDVVWVDGWEPGREGTQLRVLRQMRGRVERCSVPAAALLSRRAFEPSARAFSKLSSGVVRMDRVALERMSPLLTPGEVIGRLVPAARKTTHDIFKADTEDGPVFIPAMLLIKALWAWSDSVLSELLTPNSADSNFGRLVERDGRWEVRASHAIATLQPNDLVLRRAAWIGTDERARQSWQSVLGFAMRTRLGLALPIGELKCKAWGIHTEAGLLACELLGPHIRFELPKPDILVRVGLIKKLCPPHFEARYHQRRSSSAVPDASTEATPHAASEDDGETEAAQQSLKGRSTPPSPPQREVRQEASAQGDRHG